MMTINMNMDMDIDIMSMLGITKGQLVPAEIIERHIFLIRGQKVMLDIDPAKLYEVPTKRLRSHFATSIVTHGCALHFYVPTLRKMVHRKLAKNGWRFWKYQNSEEKWVALAELLK
jgi:hypothetical protein